MANPPQVRPWFRLTSIRPVPNPALAPAPEPRPSLPLPTFRTSSAPSSPQIHPTPQPQPQEKTTQQPPSPPPRKIVSTSLPSSPLRKAPPVSSSSSPPHKPPSPSPPPSSSSPEKKNSPKLPPNPTPHQSPKTIRQDDLSPMHSPKSKLSARPPSPLTLPPSQLKTEEKTEEPKVPVEAESKAVLVQKTIDKPNKTMHNNGSGEHHREHKNHGHSNHGKHIARREGEAKERTKGSDFEDSGMRVITIAGENRGAFMELIRSPKKKESNFLHKKGNESGKVVGGGSESSDAEEGTIKKKDKNQKGRTGSSSSFPVTAYMNSNVQCVNNSLLYHASCSHHDPGVRLSLTKKPIGEGYYLMEHVDGKKN